MIRAHVIHAGAGGDRNFGELALLLPHIHFHLFEPLPDQMAELRNRYGGRLNVTLHQAALAGPGPSTRDFYAAKPPNASTLYEEKNNIEGARQTRVACVGVNEAIKRLGEDGNIALSLSCNGAEFDIIPELLENATDLERIKLWRVAWNHNALPKLGQRRPTLESAMRERGIHNCTEAEFCVRLAVWWRRGFF